MVGYDARRGVLSLDRSRSGFLPGFAPYAAVREAPCQLPADGVLRLRILLDASSIEVLVEDGSCWLSERIIPSDHSLGVSLWSSAGSAALEHLAIYGLAL